MKQHLDNIDHKHNPTLCGHHRKTIQQNTTYTTEVSTLKLKPPSLA